MAWDAMLKKSGASLALIHDPDIDLMVRSGMRNGVSTISQRYAKASHRYRGAD